VLSEIYKAGFSRVPVYDGNTKYGNRIVGILMVKDLILLNPDRDHLALEQLTEIMR
jgi:CBS domain containing-hemolysin-like protein